MKGGGDYPMHARVHAAGKPEGSGPFKFQCAAGKLQGAATLQHAAGKPEGSGPFKFQRAAGKLQGLQHAAGKPEGSGPFKFQRAAGKLQGAATLQHAAGPSLTHLPEARSLNLQRSYVCMTNRVQAHVCVFWRICPYLRQFLLCMSSTECVR